jgi:uroporphyrin-III C-methyltransferase
MSETAKVYLVGAGPGDPELLTVKAVRLLERADVVVYDRLVSPDILSLVPRGAARIDVGKSPGRHPVPQEEINALLASLARPGRTVVRLKGGDPFIFGRGGEEFAHLAAHGIACETVPGITAAAGCAASLGIPLTHRGVAESVRFVTGHCRSDADLDLDWEGLADPDTTLVVYMGRAMIGTIVSRLLAHGLSPATPAAAVCNGTLPGERAVTAPLVGIEQAVDEAGLRGPVLFLIGRVVSFMRAADDAVEDGELPHAVAVR